MNCSSAWLWATAFVSGFNYSSVLVGFVPDMLIYGNLISFLRIYFSWLRMCYNSGSLCYTGTVIFYFASLYFSRIFYSSAYTYSLIEAILSASNFYYNNCCCLSAYFRASSSFFNLYCYSWAFLMAYCRFFYYCSISSRLYFSSLYFFSLAKSSILYLSYFSLIARSKAYFSLLRSLSFSWISRYISYIFLLLSCSFRNLYPSWSIKISCFGWGDGGVGFCSCFLFSSTTRSWLRYRYLWRKRSTGKALSTSIRALGPSSGTFKLSNSMSISSRSSWLWNSSTTYPPSSKRTTFSIANFLKIWRIRASLVSPTRSQPRTTTRHSARA